MKAVKWIGIILGCLIVLLVIAVLVIPMFVDVQKYKPEIEEKVTQATGRPFKLGGDLDISVFPWIGVGLSDLHLGNPPGFAEKDFVSVESFEVRVKLLPLLSKKVEVKRFVMKSPHILLIKGKDGIGNWEGIGKASKDSGAGKAEPAEKKTDKKEPSGGVPLKELVVGEFAITDGRIIWMDQVNNTRKEVSDISLKLKDVSPDSPIRMDLSAKLDNQPVSLQGTVGPIGLDPSKGTIPVDLAVQIFEELKMKIAGKVTDPTASRQIDFNLQVSPFSPRKVMDILKQEFPVKTSDPQALTKVALKARIRGDDKNVSISDGLLTLDQSNLDFNMEAKEFDKPNLAFNLNLDQIDLDRYLPPSEGKKGKEAGTEKEEKSGPSEKKKPDYGPLRKLILDGQIKIGQLKAHGAKVEDILMKITARGGQIRLNPLDMKLYQGTFSSTGLLDVRQDTPKSSVNLQTANIQAGPLVKDLLKKEIIEGALESKINLTMQGDDADKIKSSLNGTGSLVFKDGAIVGIDLAGMIRNVKATFGLAEKGAEKPKTDFAELSSPFTMTNGVFNTDNTNLLSPLLRVKAAGKANLVAETLDFRVEPKFVGTLKGQGDVMERAGVTVPVLVSGTFQSPKFRPDLEGMVKDTLSNPNKLKDAILGPEKEGESSGVEEKVKDLLKKMPFGR
jgi:AsmA protein